MKVIQVINCTPPNMVGGAEITAKEVRSGLISRGNEVVVITLSTNKTLPNDMLGHISLKLRNIYDPWRDKGKKNIIKKIFWKLIDFFNIFSFFDLLFAIKREGGDIVLTHNLKGFSVSAWAAALILNKKIVHVTHDYYLVCSTCALGTPGIKKCSGQCFSCKIYSLPKKILSKKVSKFISVSDYVGGIHKNFLCIPDEKFITINNTRTSFGRISFKKKVDYSECVVFGFIGRLEASKGFDIFIKAMHEVSKKNKVKVVVAGVEVVDGFLNSLCEYFESVDISWLGHVSQREFYDKVDCVIVPSVWDEPFPAVAYEPQLFGKIVVASRVGGIPEIVRDGETGYLFECGDVDGLVSVCCKILTEYDCASNLALSAFNNSDKFSDGEKMVSSYIDVISEVLGNEKLT